jgi:uncharacterized membrane protein
LILWKSFQHMSTTNSNLISELNELFWSISAYAPIYLLALSLCPDLIIKHNFSCPFVSSKFISLICVLYFQAQPWITSWTTASTGQIFFSLEWHASLLQSSLALVSTLPMLLIIKKN